MSNAGEGLGGGCSSSTDWTDSEPEESAQEHRVPCSDEILTQVQGPVGGQEDLLGRWRVKHRLGVVASVAPAIDSAFAGKAVCNQILWVTRVQTLPSGSVRAHCQNLGWVTLAPHLVERDKQCSIRQVDVRAALAGDMLAAKTVGLCVILLLLSFSRSPSVHSRPLAMRAEVTRTSWQEVFPVCHNTAPLRRAGTQPRPLLPAVRQAYSASSLGDVQLSVDENSALRRAVNNQSECCRDMISGSCIKQYDLDTMGQHILMIAAVCPAMSTAPASARLNTTQNILAIARAECIRAARVAACGDLPAKPQRSCSATPDMATSEIQKQFFEVEDKREFCAAKTKFASASAGFDSGYVVPLDAPKRRGQYFDCLMALDDHPTPDGVTGCLADLSHEPAVVCLYRQSFGGADSVEVCVTPELLRQGCVIYSIGVGYLWQVCVPHAWRHRHTHRYTERTNS